MTKCVEMRVGNTCPAHVYLNENTLPIQSSFKNVVITCNYNLSFNIHTNNICNTCYLIINRLLRFFITNIYIYTYIYIYIYIYLLKAYIYHLYDIQCTMYNILSKSTSTFTLTSDPLQIYKVIMI